MHETRPRSARLTDLRALTAVELDPAQRVEFFRDVYGPFARSLPFGATFVRIIDGVDLDHPAEIAIDRRVFELHPAP